MPAEQIARSLAFINWTVLSGLALGAFSAVLIGRLWTQATRGFLAFTGGCAAILGALAWASDAGLPAALPGSAVADPLIGDLRRGLLAGFTVLAVGYAVAVFRGRRAPGLGFLGVACGLGAMICASLSWSSGGAVGSVPVLLQLLVLAAATGGVFACMILGHWYLVTPRLPEAPLVLFARLLTLVILLQVLLFATWMATGAGDGRPPFEPLVGPWALFVWLRLLIGLLFPLAISWAAIQTARTRSMESATGLLYINVGAIAAGTVLAAGLYFGAGLLV